MIALLVLLLVTNVVTVAIVLRLWRARRGRGTESVSDPAIAELLAEVARRPSPAGGTRRVISVEILNPIELAATRGRVVGLAGSLAPGLVRRVVHEQAIRTLRQQLVEQHVAAEVRLHTLRPEPGGGMRSSAGEPGNGFDDPSSPGPQAAPDLDHLG